MASKVTIGMKTNGAAVEMHESWAWGSYSAIALIFAGREDAGNAYSDHFSLSTPQR